MNKYILFTIFIMAYLFVRGQDNVYYQTDFSNGIPNGFTIIDRDENPVKSSDFNNINPTGGWFAAPVDTRYNQAALSTSHCEYDFPNDNWLISPSIHIESENAYLKWDAKSIHYDFRDGYKVLISSSDKDFSNFKEVFSLSKEEYDWNTHTISLKDYAGKNIYIAFVHNSKNGFLLAIDNLYVGILSSISFGSIDQTERFAGDVSSALVKGILKNNGKSVLLNKIICESGGNNITTQDFKDKTLLPGEEQTFEFSIPTQVGEITNYTLKAETDETTVDFLQDSIVCSYFPRILVAEEYTGTWCNNCPAGIIEMNKLKDRYKEQIITIAGHYDDPMAYKVYSTGLGRWLFNLPAIIYNRNSNNIQNSMGNYEPLRKVLLTPTIAKVDLTAEYNNTSLITQAKVVFANDYDNSNDQYKLGYALIEKEVTYTEEVKQKNSSAIPQNGEYYYLPTVIPNELMIFHDIARGTSNAFTGIEKSLPTQIEAYKNYTYDHEIEIPETVINPDNIQIIVFILNTLTNEIINACKVESSNIPLSLGHETSTNDIKVWADRNSNCFYVEPNNVDSSYTIEFISLDGKVFNTIKSKEALCRIPFEYFPNIGCNFIRVRQNAHCITKKIILF